MNQIKKMEIQVKVINSLIKTGNVSNVYSAQGKINKLKKAINNANERERIINWLSQ